MIRNFFVSGGTRDSDKSVAHAIPMYAMQCFKLPKSILTEVERMCRNFFWGQKDREKKIA